MIIRNLTLAELPLLYKYTQKEGWDNEEIHSNALFKTHPNDFFIAYKNKQLIGFILAVKYSDDFGFISDFLVLQQFRSCGYGEKIFAYAMKHLKGCQVSLNSVHAHSKLYKKHNFLYYFDVIVYKFYTGSVTLEVPLHKAIDFDGKLSLKNQDDYMKEMFKDDKILYKAIKNQDKVSSFAFTFAHKDGYSMYLDSQDIDEALSLFFILIEKLPPNTNIYMQADKLSPVQEVVAERLKMSVDSKMYRMYNKMLPSQ